MGEGLTGYRIEPIQMREEDSLFYSDTDKDKERGCIGHLRGNFGHSGKEYYAEWSDQAGAETHKNEIFQKEFKSLIELLRMDVLADCPRMFSYCCGHKECRNDHSHVSCWDFRILTDHHAYYLRCTPILGEPNFCCYVYHRDTLFASLAQERGLLPHCFDRLDGELITIFLGEPGYYPSGLSIDKASVAELNREIGATQAQLAAMKCGSMYGWNVPGADPKEYDENGRSKNQRMQTPMMFAEPSHSPWGTVDQCKTLYPGVFEVATPRHGGIMIPQDRVGALLSEDAQKYGFVQNGYLCFEEDCDAVVVIRELLDQGLIEPKINEHFKEGEYSDCIDGVLKVCHPTYWQARERWLNDAREEPTTKKTHGGEAR